MLYISAMPATAAGGAGGGEIWSGIPGSILGHRSPHAWTGAAASRVVLEANPITGEDVHFPPQAESMDVRCAATVAHPKGKRLPLIGCIEYYPGEEEQRWLVSLNGDYDHQPRCPRRLWMWRCRRSVAPHLCAKGIPDDAPWTNRPGSRTSWVQLGTTIDGG